MDMDFAVNLCVRRRFTYPCAEIYGAPAGFYNYGPLGAQLKKCLENEWWNSFIASREDVEGIDGCILTPRQMWKASGHLDAFNDPVVACAKCKVKERADSLIERELGLSVEGKTDDELRGLIKEKELKCPKCGGTLKIEDPFNLMFKTHVGVVSDESTEAYLRPETAQLIFTDYKLAAEAARLKTPFGIGQIGRAFRNEISPRQFVFRCREFTQYELEWFYKECEEPCLDEFKGLKAAVLTAEAQEKGGGQIETKFEEIPFKNSWVAYWAGSYLKWLQSLGLRDLRLREHVEKELSHYSSETWDVEFKFLDWGWKELLGIADRSSYDLKQHAKKSGKKLELNQQGKFLPRVVEPSGGFDRLILALIVQGLEERDEKTVLKLHPAISPVQVAVFPLQKKGLTEKAREVFDELKKDFRAQYDEAGSIGKRYARSDEAGIPYCVTVDYDSLEDGAATVRDRDTGKQVRMPVEQITRLLQNSVEKYSRE
jgi:glycyl-tRNA synthetase